MIGLRKRNVESNCTHFAKGWSNQFCHVDASQRDLGSWLNFSEKTHHHSAKNQYSKLAKPRTLKARVGQTRFQFFNISRPCIKKKRHSSNEWTSAGWALQSHFFFFTSTASSFSLIFVKQNTDLCLFRFLSAFFSIFSLSFFLCYRTTTREKYFRHFKL